MRETVKDVLIEIFAYYIGIANFKRGGEVTGELKKATAEVNGASHTGYQLGKLKSKFGRKGKESIIRGYDFEDWNHWQETDGFLCRKNDDCTWLDDK